MRTAAEGLLTTADAWDVMVKAEGFYAQAHGDDGVIGRDCPVCQALWAAMCAWLAAHAAGPDDLTEME